MAISLQDLQSKIDHFGALLEKYEPAVNDRNELMTMRKGLLEDLKEVSFENEAQKEEVWDRFRSLATVFRDKMEQTNLELASFADEANRRIAELRELIEKKAMSDSAVKDDFVALRQQTDSVFEFIKQNNWPSKELRTQAWEIFNTTREQLRNRENEFYERMRDEREKKAGQSRQFAEMILEAAATCKTDVPVEQALAAWEVFVTRAKEQQLIVGEFEARVKEDAIKVPLKTQTEILRDIRKVANDNRELFIWEDRQKVYTAFDEMKSALDAAWDNYKQDLQKKRDEREQKKVEWERKQREFLTMMEGKLQKQLEYKDKLEKFGNGQQEFVVRIETRLTNQQEYLLKLHDDLDELQEQYNAAWSINFKERMQERIMQKKEKILSVEQDIESSKQKLQEVEDNVKAFPSRLLDAEKTIEEIEEKIAEVKQKLKVDNPTSGS